jgi:hypothetical protein
MEDSTRRSILARRLLATTCLTAVGGATAQAASITEPPNFGTTFATRTLLPVNTTVVTGTTSFGDIDDFVEFQGLVGGASFTLTATATISNVTVFTDSQSQIGSPLMFGSTATLPLTNTVPANGLLVVQVHLTNAETGTQSYTLNLNAPTTVPEPASSLTLGLGLVGVAGALAARRFRRKSQSSPGSP